MNVKRIVVAGGGFAGVYCAKYLAGRLKDWENWEVVLLSEDSYLLFYPLLIKVAVGEVEPRHASVFLRSYLRRGRIILGHFKDFDSEQRTLRYEEHLQEGPKTLDYEHLILAFGSSTPMPDIPGLSTHGRSMHSISDALTARRDLLDRFERANSSKDEAQRRLLLSVAVIGGGYTGCELASEIYEFLQEAQSLYPNVRSDEPSVHLVEQKDQLLPGFPANLAKAALARLESQGVNVHLNEGLAKIAQQKLELASGKILHSDMVFWCAGAGPSQTTQELNLPKNKQGFIKTTQYLNVLGMNDVWAIGDCAANPSPASQDGPNYPPTAQMAYKQARHLARNLLRTLRGRSPLACRVKSAGMIVPLGRSFALGQFGRVTMRGVLPYLLWGVFYSAKIPGFSYKLKVAFDLIMDRLFGRDLGDPGLLSQPVNKARKAA